MPSTSLAFMRGPQCRGSRRHRAFVSVGTIVVATMLPACPEPIYENTEPPTVSPRQMVVELEREEDGTLEVAGEITSDRARCERSAEILIRSYDQRARRWHTISSGVTDEDGEIFEEIEAEPGSDIRLEADATKSCEAAGASAEVP